MSARAGTATIPDPTAVRAALWRALHVRVDDPPHVLVARYFAGRSDGLRPSDGEEFVTATS